MTLPKLNIITYELDLPSTGETLNFRPFLVKEQNNLQRDVIDNDSII